MPILKIKTKPVQVPVGVKGPSVPSFDWEDLLKKGKDFFQDVLHSRTRFTFYTSFADVMLHFNRYRHYQFVFSQGDHSGQGGGAWMAKMLREIGLQTLPANLIRVIVNAVDKRQVGMLPEEANFFPIWPLGKSQPTDPKNANFIGAVFYGADQNWYIAINQEHLGRYMLGPKYPNIRYKDINPYDPDHPEKEQELTTIRQNTGTPGNGAMVPGGKNQYNFDRMVVNLLPDDPYIEPNDNEYIDPDLSWFRGKNRVFKSMPWQDFKSAVGTYTRSVWKDLKSKGEKPVHEIRLLDPAVRTQDRDFGSTATVKPTTPQPLKARLVTGKDNAPLLLPAPKQTP